MGTSDWLYLLGNKTFPYSGSSIRNTDLWKLFFLYISQKRRIALYVLTQRLGQVLCPVTYFSKNIQWLLEGNSSYCYAKRRSYRTNFESDSHQVRAILPIKGCDWEWPSGQVSDMPLDNPEVTNRTCTSLKLASLKPISLEAGHTYKQVISQTMCKQAAHQLPAPPGPSGSVIHW